MKTSELRHLSADALGQRASELAREIAELRFKGLSKEKNVRKIRSLRRDRARTLTIIRELLPAPRLP